jgi:osmotically-inducible protein OsmY
MNRSGMAKVGAGGALGLAAGYLLDPDRGRARRARLRDQTQAALRRDARRVGQRAHYERGRLAGVAHRFKHPDAGPPVDDRMLIDRVRSQGLGRMPELAHRISLDARTGVVTLRGQLDDGSQIARVRDAVSRVAGVERVINLLHLAGEAAPNKADALRAGSS